MAQDQSSDGSTCPDTTTLSRAGVEDVIIIGSGPAGLTAALYTARANLKPLVLEGDGFNNTMPGGQLMTTSEVENYPGIYKHRVETDANGNVIAHVDHFMTGPEMMAILRAQAQKFGATCMFKRVIRVDFSCRPFRVETDEKKYYTEAVIIATGASARWLEVPGENDYKNFGVTACATCDGALFKEKDVIVIGGGDTAMEEANYLTRHCKTVTVVHRRNEFRASRIMLERAQQNPKIKWILNAHVTEVLGKQDGFKKSVNAVTLRDTSNGKEWNHPTEGVFVAIGHKPNTEIFDGLLEMDDLGYIRTRGRSTMVNKANGEMQPGVFACGDCQDHVYRQAVTAAGTGCAAAIDAERFVAANPILYGIEEEDSQSYMNLMAAGIRKGGEMPKKDPTIMLRMPTKPGTSEK